MSSSIETAKKGYELFQRGDIAALLNDIVDDNSHWILPGKDKLPWAGSFKGKQEIANFFTQLHQHWEITEFTPHDMIERGDTVVVIGTSSGHPRGKGGPVTVNAWVHVVKYSPAGKLIFFQEYADTAAMASALS